ncbi:MAG TPA: pseudouridine synthase [Steroidobacteraceae bacterium]|jgi:23S rRNA pseudouridine2605 synthase|nr:pseudouridine synthase [Steroidobacteraceae bacterium]
MNAPPQTERLQKLLASAGFGSRRAIEEWIRAGRVTVNGRTVQLGDRAGTGDDIRLDGKPLAVAGVGTEAKQLLVYNKPLDEVTTRSDPQGRRTVFESLPPAGAGRWISIGRLDINTSGLLLFTTDGELAHRLMHPSSEVEREYLVTVTGHPGPEAVYRLRSGVTLDDGPARFDHIEPVVGTGPDTAFRVILREGRNREVRRMWNAVGYEVARLARVRYGPVRLPPDLPPGKWRAVPVEVMAGIGAPRQGP